MIVKRRNCMFRFGSRLSLTIKHVRLNKFREDVPVQFVGSKGPPDEETSAMTNYVGEKFHVQKILNEESGMSGYISNDGMAYTGVSTAEKQIPILL